MFSLLRHYNPDWIQDTCEELSLESGPTVRKHFVMATLAVILTYLFAPCLAEQEKPAPGDTPWGETVDGLQGRAWVEQNQVLLASRFKVHFELRNVGKKEVTILRYGYPHHVHVEWLSRKDRCHCKNQPGSGMSIRMESFQSLKPGAVFRGALRMDSLKSQFAEARPEKARLQVVYFVFPAQLRSFPNAWGTEEKSDALRSIRSNVVELSLVPRMPGDAYWSHCDKAGYSLEDAWVMADIVARARVTKTPRGRGLVLSGYRKEEERTFMLREGIGLEIDRALKGEVKERTLQVSCLTDPACEQFEATGQEVVAFISALPRDGGGHLRLFKTIPSDPLNEAAAKKLAALTPGPWGEPEGGLACRLLGPGDEISAARKALFSVFLKVVPQPNGRIAYLDRDSARTVIHFKNTKTGKEWERSEYYYGPSIFPRASDRTHIADEPLRPVKTRISLFDSVGQEVPPGDYFVRATYRQSFSEGTKEQFPWTRQAWSGTIHSGKLRLKVVQAEPVTKEVSVMAEIAADRSEGVLALHGGGARREVIALERTPGLYLITHRALTVFHKGERVARRDSYGTGTGGTSYLSGLSQNCIDRHELKLVVDIRIWESSRFGKGYSHRRPDQPVLWKKKLEKTLPSVMSDQPMYGDWGEQENGLRSRLILSHQSVRKADEPFLFLDVRNDSGKPVTLFGGKGMAANLAVIGPDGKRVKALMSFVPEDIGWWNVSEGKESNSLALVMKKAFSLERPGDYRIEWKGGKVEGHQKEPDADRTFRYPPKAPPVSLRIE